MMGTQFVLLLLVLAAVLAHRREGTLRVRGVLAGLGFFSRGRVQVCVWVYRPGRVYFRVGVANGA